jgi:hypothetical protein
MDRIAHPVMASIFRERQIGANAMKTAICLRHLMIEVGTHGITQQTISLK